jgi:hypothetical protein
MSLAELETVALANNPEIRVAMYRGAIAERRVRSAGSLSDPVSRLGHSARQAVGLNQT